MTPTTEPTQAEQAPPPIKKYQIIAKKMATAEKITRDHATQVRGRIDSNKVKEYEVIIREHGLMDAVDLFTEVPMSDPPVYWLADGFHRIDAYAAAGVLKFPANIRAGSKSDAIRFSLERNGHHGAQMTSAEKRHAAEVAVQDAEIGSLTDKEIAAMVGCSPALVSEARRGVTRDSKRQKRKSVPVEAHERSAPGQASGKRETESTAPRSATARERTVEDKQPTKAMILKQLESHLTSEVIDEQDVLKLMEAKDGEWIWMPKPGGLTTLKVVGKTGRVQVEIPAMVVKEITFTGITLKNDKDAKLAVVGTEE